MPVTMPQLLFLVLQIAKRQAVVNPENTFFSVKRFIGRKVSARACPKTAQHQGQMPGVCDCLVPLPAY